MVLREATLRPVPRAVFRAGDAVPRVGGMPRRLVATLAAGAAIAAALVLLLRPLMTPGGRGAVAELSLDDVAASAFAIGDSDWLRADADDLRWEAALRGERVCDIDDSDADCS